MLIVGAGAGGGVLAQRLARAGWRVVVLERGPMWDPDRDWVSDEKGSGGLYWTEKRIVSGNDPIQMGKNNSGVGVGGSMTHFAGYVPRLHPSDFEMRTRDGVGVDWPISYWELQGVVRADRARAAGRGRVLAVGRPARLPARPAPGRGRRVGRLAGRAQLRDRDARRPGRDHERRLRQPAALHLPRLLPRGLQGEREGLAADHALPRRDRARLRGARRLDGDARGGRRRDRARLGRDVRLATARSAFSARTPSRCAATRSRRRGSC